MREAGKLLEKIFPSIRGQVAFGDNDWSRMIVQKRQGLFIALRGMQQPVGMAEDALQTEYVLLKWRDCQDCDRLGRSSWGLLGGGEQGIGLADRFLGVGH